jgi:hypothetical protein
MLYGEPGCGKTSFIKALANELDRCIIPIFLDKFTSVNSFKQLFQSEYMFVKEKDNYCNWMYLPMNKRLIVFEEIDTAGTIIMDRNKLKEIVKNKEKEIKENKLYRKLLKNCDNKKNTDSDNPDDWFDTQSNINTMGINTIGRGSTSYDLRGITGAANEGIFVKDINKYVKNESKKITSNKKNKQQNELDDELIDDDIFEKFIRHKSGLTLGDILDTLDGLCESSGLAYIMTTNHIDLLDPALIRPGRITYIAHLEEIRYNEIKAMLTYYYITNNCYDEDIANDKKIQMVEEIAVRFDGKFNPSKLEEFCKIYTLNELFIKMNEL